MILRPELELLVTCARARLQPQLATRIADLLDGPLDWTYLLRTAYMHGVMPLLYSQLRAFDSAVPEHVRAKLSEDYRLNAGSNLFLATQLLKLLRFFEAAAIPCVAYKGPLLAVSAYQDIALRVFGDVDLLVRRRDLLTVRRILTDAGFVQRFDEQRIAEHHFAYVFSPFRKSEDAFFLSRWEHEFEHAQDGYVVDVHQQLFPSYFAFRMHIDDLWQRLEPVSVCGVTVRGLGIEDQLLMLCAYGAKDCWTSLARICDVAELMRGQPDLDWGRLFERARVRGGARMLSLGLRLAHDVLGAPLPAVVCRVVLNDPAVASLARRVTAELFSASQLTLEPTTDVKSSIVQFHLRTRERLRDRLAYCALMAVTPSETDWSALHLPVQLALLYYPLRPLRLLGALAARRVKQRRAGHAAPL